MIEYIQSLRNVICLNLSLIQRRRTQNSISTYFLKIQVSYKFCSTAINCCSFLELRAHKPSSNCVCVFSIFLIATFRLCSCMLPCFFVCSVCRLSVCKPFCVDPCVTLMCLHACTRMGAVFAFVLVSLFLLTGRRMFFLLCRLFSSVSLYVATCMFLDGFYSSLRPHVQAYCVWGFPPESNNKF